MRSAPRLVLLCALMAGFTLVITWRLYALQVRDAEEFRRLASSERRAEVPILPRRGALMDAEGNPLALTVSYDSLYVIGKFVHDPDGTAATLSKLLGMPIEEIRPKLDKESARRVLLKAELPAAVSEQLRRLENPGLDLRPEPARRYPEGSLAADTLGFVGRDFRGLAGLELSYDEEVGGTPGALETERDPSNMEIVLGERVLTPPRDGSNLVLTLDRFVQRTAERLLNEGVRTSNARGGLILVMDVKTGSLLAAATNPTYSLAEDEIYKPEKDALYKSSIVTTQYEPGSTMKLITMAGALEEGLVNPNTVMNDTGWANVGGAGIRNWDGAANGQITMTQVLIKSSNVGTQWVGSLLGPERFYRNLDAFGFGSPTGLRLPGEIEGTVRTNTSPGWTRVDLATNSYGQGIAVTPIQLISAVAALGNDGVLMKPRLVRELRGPDGTQVVEPKAMRQAISPRTAHTMLQMMEAVAQQEALMQHRIPGYRMALKTGTADTPTAGGYDLDQTYASVAAIFPADNPRFAALVRLDSPPALYGGVVAAPVLKQLAQELFRYYRIPPTEPVPTNNAAR